MPLLSLFVGVSLLLYTPEVHVWYLVGREFKSKSEITFMPSWLDFTKTPTVFSEVVSVITNIFFPLCVNQ